jgi:hypothetical protein
MVTGFPEDIAARMTVFIGEGDEVWSGDSFKFNNTKLLDDDNIEGLGGGNTNNVWNGQSIGKNDDGVDIDTFYVRWEDNLLFPDDTSAKIDLLTNSDSRNLVYILLSFRSVSSTGGAITYLIR